MTSTVIYAAIVVTGIGMMLVVAGVVATGFFLPGVILIGVGVLGFAAGAILHAVRPTRPGVPPEHAGS
ncbi:MAG TPA: hypothetical protein VK929_12965 [Longimicrobiales bacterium]|nr:hypothetical protein [Longimicrobiales bacterium]